MSLIKATLSYFHWIIFKQWALSQKYNIPCLLKTTACTHTIFTWMSSAMKQLLEKFNFKLLHAFNFFYA